MPQLPALSGIPVLPQIPEAPSNGSTSQLVVPAQTMVTDIETLPTAGTSVALGCASIYLGEGLSPVSEKVAEKIRTWQFVDMAELLPEPWGSSSTAQEGSSSSQQRHKRKKQVTDIVSWLECFGVYVSVIAGVHRKSVPELMLRASQDFEDPAWLTYDLAFRRQAAATKNRQWSRLNPTLYNICMAGKARKITRFELCLS